MYYYLKGVVTIHLKDSIVLEVNGIGYQVLVSHPNDYDLGSTIRVYTSLYARDDTQFLVGFSTFAEKAIYEKLITVKGVGPHMAMTVLGGASVERIKEAIDNSDVLFLKRLPGIGPKTASQIVLDLRGKLTLPEGSASGDKNLDDALIGLRNMGFGAEEVARVADQIPDRGLTTEEYLQRALALIGRGK